MEKNLEQRIAIKCCFKLGKIATETFQLLNEAYGLVLLYFGGMVGIHQMDSKIQNKHHVD